MTERVKRARARLKELLDSDDPVELYHDNPPRWLWAFTVNQNEGHDNAK